jgi:RHS repeat-associated protein
VLAEDAVNRYQYAPGAGRLERMELVNLGVQSTSFYPEWTTRTYDLSGNVEWARRERMGDGGGIARVVHEVLSRSYYSAEDRLRYFNETDVQLTGQVIERRGVWEEYRYDPLGRRVLVNTRRAGLCDANSFLCASATTRFVWAGDQLLWEVKTASESAGETAGAPEAYGVVSYFHAGGIDRPLVITKGSTSIIPHQNWRGQFARGTYGDGRPSDCETSQTTGCTPIQWPGYRTTAWHAAAKDPDIRNWFGGLTDGMRDASGQMYKRNRYYDPATGQFTQPDPIGIAGGLNVYGFAVGDPVSYSDPYGLKVEHENDGARRLWGRLQAEVTRGLNSSDSDEREAARVIAQAMHRIEADDNNTLNLKVGSLGPVDQVLTWAAGGARTVPRGSSMTSARTTMFSGRVQGLDPVIVLAHEVGHVAAIMGRQPPNLAGLPTENAARTLMGCSRFRALEYSPPPSCN